jgi:ribonuclease P protein component
MTTLCPPSPLIPVDPQRTAQSTRQTLRPLTFPKRKRILKSTDFRLVGRCGQKRVGQFLVVELLTWRNPRRPTQLGLTVPKRFGDAVTRNRFKRQVRESFRLMQHHLLPGLGCVVAPRSEAQGASSAQIAEELKELMAPLKSNESGS